MIGPLDTYTIRDDMKLEVADNLHMIRTEYYGIYTAMYLVTGEKLTLIDSGEMESWEESIKPYLKYIRRDPSEIELVVLTHNHDDHVGSARQIREETGATLAAGKITSNFLANPESIMKWEEESFSGWLSEDEKQQILMGTDYNGPPRKMRKPLFVDRVLEEREIIDADPFKFQVLGIPGHTIDGIGLNEKNKRIVFTGDTVSGHGTDLDDIIVIQSLDEFEMTLNQLEKMETNLLLTSHPYLPFRETVLHTEKAKELIRVTQEMSSQISKEILAALASTNRPMTTGEISSVVCSLLGPNKPGPRGHGTIRVHLIRHLKQERVNAQKKNNQVWWTIK